jgi:hypothetical protein
MRLGLSVAAIAGLVQIPFQAHITLGHDQIHDPDDHCSHRQPSAVAPTGTASEVLPAPMHMWYIAIHTATSQQKHDSLTNPQDQYHKESREVTHLA